MRALIAITMTAMLVAGCDNGQRQQAQPVQSIKVRSAEQDQLFKLNDLNRAIALKRAIYDSGYQCQRITKSGFVGAYKNLDMWMASCADGRDWAIFTGPDGSAQVRDCKDVNGLGLPKCAIKSNESEPPKAG
ncbi:MAG TPA: hypothetical protein VNS53_05960 [Sphingomicrobium sp.]|jgi:hypothetical protein|nr:hypothetical protein [Sphingomicrobium sp.]